MNAEHRVTRTRGWDVVAGAFLVMFFIQGARTVIGVMFKPMIQELAWSRSAISMAAFINMAVFALSLTLVGKYYDRYGAKRIVVLSSLLVGISYISIALVQSLWSFILLYGILAALGFGGTSIPLFGALISKWFNRHRGLAISIALAGGCLGQYVIVPLTSSLVNTYGWRSSFAILGVTIACVNLLVAQFLLKEKSTTLDCLPDTESKDPLQTVIRSTDLNLFQASRTGSFWLFLVVMFICGGGDYLVLTHLIPMVTDFGIPASTAGKMLGWAGFFSLIGVLLTGPVTDRFGNKPVIIVTFVLRTVIFLVVCRYRTLTSFYLFALAFGFTMLITAPITTTLVGKLYGFTHIGIITGFITTVHHFSGGLWAWLGGVIFDATGSYRAAFLMSAVSACIALGCAIMIREQKHSARDQNSRPQASS